MTHTIFVIYAFCCRHKVLKLTLLPVEWLETLIENVFIINADTRIRIQNPTLLENKVLVGACCIQLFLWVSTLSCCLTRSRSQEEAFSRITLRMGCQSSEMSEPSVTEARTLTRRPLLLELLGTPRTYRDCFPTSLRGFRYKLHKYKRQQL